MPVLSINDAVKVATRWRQSEIVVFANGCFDLFHAGHLHLLSKAKTMGTRLLVAINSDASVRALKGPTRPIVTQEDRAEMVAALRVVDAVTIFAEPTPIELIRAIRPHVLVKGDEYRGQYIAGAELLPSWGGRLVLVPRDRDRSTTGIIAQMASVSCSRQ